MRTAALILLAISISISSRAQLIRQNSQTSETLFTISMMDDLNGVAAGSQQVLARTTNAGEHWDAVNDIFGHVTFYCSYFNDTSSGAIAGSDGQVLVKHPGRGESFQLLPERKNIRGITFPTSEDLGNPRDLLCVGDTGMIYFSGDSGKNWTKINPPKLVQTRSLYGVTYWDDSTWWIVGEAGLVLYTEDAGATWQRIIVPSTKNLYSICFPGDWQSGWIVGDSTILYTTDGGDVWTDVPTTANLRRVDGYGDTGLTMRDTGFAVGMNGVVMTTTDLVHWSPLPTGTTANLYGIAITNNLYIVGDTGIILTSFVSQDEVAELKPSNSQFDVRSDGLSLQVFGASHGTPLELEIYDLLGVERDRVSVMGVGAQLHGRLSQGVYLYKSSTGSAGKFLVP